MRTRLKPFQESRTSYNLGLYLVFLLKNILSHLKCLSLLFVYKQNLNAGLKLQHHHLRAGLLNDNISSSCAGLHQTRAGMYYFHLTTAMA